MSKEFPITISSWTMGDQCKFEDRVKAAKEAGYEGIGLRAETYVDALTVPCSSAILRSSKQYSSSRLSSLKETLFRSEST